MSEFILRPATAADAPDMIDIWTRSFGDSPEFVSALLKEADLLSGALCAKAAGKVKSVMFAFEGLSLGGVPAAYLYALCTHPDARGHGMGSAVVRALAERCFDRGAELVFLAPADAGLAAWYERILNAKPMSGFEDIPQTLRSRGAVCQRISASEYAAARTNRGGVTAQLLSAQSVLHRFFGGGFFRLETESGVALACAEPKDGSVLIRELLCTVDAVPEVCGALADYYGCGRAFLRSRLSFGSDLVYITKDIICKETVNIIENTPFFYTLE